MGGWCEAEFQFGFQHLKWEAGDGLVWESKWNVKIWGQREENCIFCKFWKWEAEFQFYFQHLKCEAAQFGNRHEIWKCEASEEKIGFFVNSENGRLMGGWVSVLLSTPKMWGWRLLSLGIEVKYENVRPERRKLHFFVNTENGRLSFSFASNT